MHALIRDGSTRKGNPSFFFCAMRHWEASRSHHIKCREGVAAAAPGAWHVYFTPNADSQDAENQGPPAASIPSVITE
jgi:hypothetical protein